MQYHIYTDAFKIRKYFFVPSLLQIVKLELTIPPDPLLRESSVFYAKSRPLQRKLPFRCLSQKKIAMIN